MIEVLQLILGWQFAFASIFCAMTVAALSLMPQERKDEIALWLMGAMPEQTWHTSFLAMFDVLFGKRHFSWQCLIVSAIVSTVAISAIWYVLYQIGAIRVEMGQTTLMRAILIGIAINIIADYVSLWETRLLLRHMPGNALLQVLVLILDAALTGAIILGTIWLVSQTGLVPPDRADPLTVVLAFSIYSAPFYSTFITSVWSWMYILSTWVLRLFSGLRLSRILDVEHKPILILSLTLSVIFYGGLTVTSKGLEKNPTTGMSPLDMLACTTFKGEICLLMIGVTDKEETQFLMQSLACEGGAGLFTCQQRAFEQREVTPERAAVLWRSGCEGGHTLSCSNLGSLYIKGLGVELDYDQARIFNQKACTGGYARGCTNLGTLQTSKYGDADYVRVRQLYLEACERGDAMGCSVLGALYFQGLGGDLDYEKVRVFYKRACDNGYEQGCKSFETLLFRV